MILQRLPTFKNWRTFNTGVTEENKKKNRSSSVIPCEFTLRARVRSHVRVHLLSSTSFI